MRNLILGILTGIALIHPVYAFNLSFMDYSPAYYFTKSDWTISQNTAEKALNSARDNAKVSWNNPETNAHGYVIPFNTTVQNGRKCRQLKIFSEAHGYTGESVYPFCKINGEWRIAN